MLVARVIGLSTFTALMLVGANEAVACSCPPIGPPCQNVFHVDAVFAGTVQTITALPDDGPPLRPGELRLPPGYRVEFTAVVPYRGARASGLSVITSGSGASCGYAFKQGERYLVYAHRTPDGRFVAGSCSRTRPLGDAGDDLRFLQTLSATSDPQARVYGTVTHWERDLATGQAREHGPVPDVLVHVRGLGKAFDAWTDTRGRYEIKLPPGKYDVSALPPAGFSLQHLQQSIELREAQACFVANFAVRFDGRIRGLIRLSSGEPAAGVPVQAMAAEDVGKAGNIQTLRTSSDSGGRFEFADVSPGRYVVGVDLTRRMDADVIFPTTLHPGTPDAAVATVIQIDGGQHRDLEPIVLPPARRTYRLTGVVAFQDGTPASGAFISLVDGTATWRQVAAAIKTQVDGTFAFLVHEGLGYVARATYWDEAQRNQITGTVGPFVVTRDTGPLKVVLSAAR